MLKGIQIRSCGPQREMNFQLCDGSIACSIFVGIAGRSVLLLNSWAFTDARQTHAFDTEELTSMIYGYYDNLEVCFRAI